MGHDVNGQQFPAQKKTDAQKTKKWMQECIDAAEQIAIYRNDRLRMNYRNKRANYMLMMNQLDPTDMSRITNPYGLQSTDFPANMQNYPIVMPRINVLIGEEIKRRFDWRLRITNDEAINRKQEEIRNKITDLYIKYSTNLNLSEKDFQKELDELEKWKNYSFKDIRETEGTNIMAYMWEYLNLKQTFSRGFEDALIAGEEIYSVSIVSGNVKFERLNPLKTYVVGAGDSPYFEDAEIIVIDDYIPIGAAIDKYHEYLTDTQIDYLEKGISGGNDFNRSISIGEREPSIVMSDGILAPSLNNGEESILVNEEGSPMAQGFNRYGEIRELRVLWKSRRKLLKIKYYDEDGNEQYSFEDERYTPNEAEGEEIVGHIWINEWMKGARLGDDEYIAMGPLEFQMRDMDNPSICNPGIIGTVYQINSNSAVSFLDMMKPYQYFYNTMMYRTELAIAKSHGKMVRLDTSLMPDDITQDEWFYYMTQMGIILEDPFTEANSDGNNANLAQLSRGAKDINLENSQYISQHIQMMQYLDEQCGRISGVTMQREGQVSSSETLGGVERSVMQSNNITEKYFSLHDNTKLRAMSVILEAAKYAWKNLKTKKLQYTLSDMSNVVFDVDVEQFRESNYDLFMSNSSSDTELMQSLKSLAQAGIQNDKINFSQLMDIYMSPSIADIRRKIEKDEMDKETKIEEQQEAERQTRIKEAEMNNEAVKYTTDKKIEHEANQKQLDRDKDILIEKLKQSGNVFNKSIEQDKKALQEDKQKHELEKQKKEHEFLKAEKEKDRAASKQKKSTQ